MTKFKSGADWTGNAKGRPPDFRIKLTKETVEKYYADTHEILDILVKLAKEEQKAWAIKLYLNAMLPFMLSKPPAQIDMEDNAKVTAMLEHLTQQPHEKLVAALKIFTEDTIGDLKEKGGSNG